MGRNVARALMRAVSALVPTLVLVQAQLPLEPKHDSGQSVTAAFEGWYKNPDDTFNILLGYYNRNLKQDLDIPI
jgi:hypothetical protein